MEMIDVDTESEVARGRRRLRDERLVKFLRACKNYDNILACRLISYAMDEGKSLDEIF